MTFQDPPAAQIALAEAAARSVPPPPQYPAPSARFVGATMAFWRIQLRGALLLAATLGIYRFWLATDVRRFLWSNTEIAGESLEYNGTATEILIGFLIAVALLIPLNLGLFLLALTLGPAGEFISVMGFPILFVLGQYAIFRARRYRLTRTVLRGVRCQQTGSAVRYAFCATFWWILIVLTLGLAYPFAQASLERYKMRNTFYGDLAGRFEGSGWRLFFRGLLLWLLVVVPFVLGAITAIAAVDWTAFDQVMSNPAATDFSQIGGLLEAGFIAGTGLAIGAGLALLLFPAFQAMTLRWWLTGLRFGELSVVSHLATRKIYGAYLRFLWYASLYSMLAAAGGFLGFLAFGAAAPSLGGLAELAGVSAWVVLYVVVMLGYSAIYQSTVRLTLWRHGVDTAALHGVEVLERVKATGGPGSPLGEGLADALNVGGI